MGMLTQDLKRMRSLVNQAKRIERRSSNDMYSFEQLAKRQQSQLECCLNYKEESLNGLQSAKDSGLSLMQIRECRLLVEYLDSVLETRQYKADISQENYENAKILWQENHEYLQSLKKKLQQLEKENSERMIDDIKPVHNKTYRTYNE